MIFYLVVKKMCVWAGAHTKTRSPISWKIVVLPSFHGLFKNSGWTAPVAALKAGRKPKKPSNFLPKPSMNLPKWRPLERRALACYASRWSRAELADGWSWTIGRSNMCVLIGIWIAFVALLAATREA